MGNGIPFLSNNTKIKFAPNPNIRGQGLEVFTIATRLGMTKDDINVLYHKFKFTDISKANVISRGEFIASHGIYPEWPVHVMFKSMSNYIGCNYRHTLTFCEYMVAFWNFCTAERSEMAEMLFNYYHTFGNGRLNGNDQEVLTCDEVDHMIETIWGKSSMPRIHEALEGLHKNSLGVPDYGEITILELVNITHKSAAIVYPLSDMQIKLQESLFGHSFWNKLQARRQERYRECSLADILPEYFAKPVAGSHVESMLLVPAVEDEPIDIDNKRVFNGHHKSHVDDQHPDGDHKRKHSASHNDFINRVGHENQPTTGAVQRRPSIERGIEDKPKVNHEAHPSGILVQRRTSLERGSEVTPPQVSNGIEAHPVRRTSSVGQEHHDVGKQRRPSLDVAPSRPDSGVGSDGGHADPPAHHKPRRHSLDKAPSRQTSGPGSDAGSGSDAPEHHRHRRPSLDKAPIRFGLGSDGENADVAAHHRHRRPSLDKAPSRQTSGPGSDAGSGSDAPAHHRDRRPSLDTSDVAPTVQASGPDLDPGAGSDGHVQPSVGEIVHDSVDKVDARSLGVARRSSVNHPAPPSTPPILSKDELFANTSALANLVLLDAKEATDIIIANMSAVASHHHPQTFQAPERKRDHTTNGRLDIEPDERADMKVANKRVVQPSKSEFQSVHDRHVMMDALHYNDSITSEVEKTLIVRRRPSLEVTGPVELFVASAENEEAGKHEKRPHHHHKEPSPVLTVEYLKSHPGKGYDTEEHRHHHHHHHHHPHNDTNG